MTLETINKPSADTQALAVLLGELEIEETISYERLSQSIGRDVQSVARMALHSARRIVTNEKGYVFSAVRTVGIKRLNDSEIMDKSDNARKSIGRKCRRTAKELTCVKFDNLNSNDKARHNTSLALMGILSEVSRTASYNRLENKIKKSSKPLPTVKAVLEALGAKV